uniref:Uncharacterized protein n=1 Tax=Arundo donax TaxID=35708 RepID=A0A0A8ZLF4_ARUDO
MSGVATEAVYMDKFIYMHESQIRRTSCRTF